ncbi:MAG: tRNA lysidine(34) synthetase TilS [Acidobacteriota bacterium]
MLAARRRDQRGPRGRLLACHVDHRLDTESSERAAHARTLAAALDVDFRLEVLDSEPPPGESIEAWARRVRYARLLEVAAALDDRSAGDRPADDRAADERSAEHRPREHRAGESLVLTAHHADDQAETLLLRMSQGSGLRGLAGIRSRHGRIVRPLLALRRADLRRLAEAEPVLRTRGLRPSEDPSNRDPRFARSRLRHGALPRLAARHDHLAPRLARLAATATTARERIDGMLAPRLRLKEEIDGARLDRRALRFLPSPLRRHALALLHQHAGAPHPASSAAIAELERQLDLTDAVGCDAGHGWRWQGDARRLWLHPAANRQGHFTYTLEIPGAVAIPELGCLVRIEPCAVESWMFHGHARRAGLDLAGVERVEIRNRRPGDRIRPLGGPGSKALKALFIDRRIPRHRRDTLPLLVIDDHIAWVPGVTIDERHRLAPGQSHGWRVEIHRLPAFESTS